MDAEHRFGWFVTFQVGVLGFVAGLVGELVLFAPFGWLSMTSLALQGSGTGAVVAHWLLRVLFPAMAVLFVLLPFLAAGYLATRDHNGAELLGTGFTLLALLVLFLAAYSLAPVVALGATDGLAEQRGLSVQVAFDYSFEPTDDRRGVLTVTHDGGERVPVETLTVVGEGITDVPGAQQTTPGRWQGETTGDAGNEWVAANDSVTVGVAADCVVRVVYRDAVTVGKYDCSERSGQ